MTAEYFSISSQGDNLDALQPRARNPRGSISTALSAARGGYRDR